MIAAAAEVERREPTDTSIVAEEHAELAGPRRGAEHRAAALADEGFGALESRHQHRVGGARACAAELVPARPAGEGPRLAEVEHLDGVAVCEVTNKIRPADCIEEPRGPAGLQALRPARGEL